MLLLRALYLTLNPLLNCPQNTGLFVTHTDSQLTMANKHAALSHSLTRPQLTESLFIALIFAALPLVLATTDPSDGTFHFTSL